MHLHARGIGQRDQALQAKHLDKEKAIVDKTATGSEGDATRLANCEDGAGGLDRQGANWSAPL
jgi:hypothetical protein